MNDHLLVESVQVMSQNKSFARTLPHRQRSQTLVPLLKPLRRVGSDLWNYRMYHAYVLQLLQRLHPLCSCLSELEREIGRLRRPSRIHDQYRSYAMRTHVNYDFTFG